MHGYGRYVLPDGKRYEGQYKDDQKHGFGIYIWPDGRLYKGFWQHGKQHGLAEYQTISKDEDGDASSKSSKLYSRYGLWQNGKRIRWLKIDRTAPIAAQLHAIEEQTVAEQHASIDDRKFFTFKSPPHFYESLAQAYVDANYHKQILNAAKKTGNREGANLDIRAH